MLERRASSASLENWQLPEVVHKLNREHAKARRDVTVHEIHQMMSTFMEAVELLSTMDDLDKARAALETALARRCARLLDTLPQPALKLDDEDDAAVPAAVATASERFRVDLLQWARRLVEVGAYRLPTEAGALYAQLYRPGQALAERVEDDEADASRPDGGDEEGDELEGDGARTVRRTEGAAACDALLTLLQTDAALAVGQKVNRLGAARLSMSEPVLKATDSGGLLIAAPRSAVGRERAASLLQLLRHRPHAVATGALRLLLWDTSRALLHRAVRRAPLHAERTANFVTLLITRLYGECARAARWSRVRGGSRRSRKGVVRE